MRGRRRRREEKKEEGRRQEIKGMDLYGFLWNIVWNLYEICMDLFVWILVWMFGIPLCLCRILIGLVVVLNRGKICIEKMLGFRGDDVHFFSTHVFASAINLVITHSN